MHASVLVAFYSVWFEAPLSARLEGVVAMDGKSR